MSNTQRTVRARILVAVDTDGDWSSVGTCDLTDEDMRKRLTPEDMACGIIAYHWIEADIPVPIVPDETTVEGVVTDGGQEILP